MKAILLKLLCSRLGWVLKFLVSLVSSYIIYFLTDTLGIELPAEKQVEIVGFITLAIYAGLQAIVLKVQFDGSEAIQKKLKEFDPQQQVDRWEGEFTQATLERLLRKRADDAALANRVPVETSEPN